MNIDKNQLIGIVLIVLLFIGFTYFSPKEPEIGDTTTEVTSSSEVSANTTTSAIKRLKLKHLSKERYYQRKKLQL